MAWKTISSKTMIENEYVAVKSDCVELEDGLRIDDFYTVRISDAASICALTEDKNILLKKEYRYACNEEMIELPAGQFEKGEEPLEVAKRELLEETGYVANSTTYLGCIYPTCGYSNEKIHIYLAKDLIKKERHLDDDEVIDLYFFSLDEIKKMILKGEIKDAKTICAIQYLNLINP